MDDVVEIDIAPRPSCLICNDGAEFPSEEHLEDHVVNYHQTTFEKYQGSVERSRFPSQFALNPMLAL